MAWVLARVDLAALDTCNFVAITPILVIHRDLARVQISRCRPLLAPDLPLKTPLGWIRSNHTLTLFGQKAPPPPWGRRFKATEHPGEGWLGGVIWEQRHFFCILALACLPILTSPHQFMRRHDKESVLLHTFLIHMSFSGTFCPPPSLSMVKWLYVNVCDNMLLCIS